MESLLFCCCPFNIRLLISMEQHTQSKVTYIRGWVVGWTSNLYGAAHPVKSDLYQRLSRRLNCKSDSDISPILPLGYFKENLKDTHGVPSLFLPFPPFPSCTILSSPLDPFLSLPSSFFLPSSPFPSPNLPSSPSPPLPFLAPLPFP